MVWFKIDDTLSAHPKARRAGLAAMGRTSCRPASIGGADTEDNLQTLCMPCNRAKGARV